MYEKIYESSTLVEIDEEPLLTWRYLFYLKDWDAFLALSAFHYAKVFRDGTTICFGKRSGGYEPLGRVHGLVAYWNQWDGKLYDVFQINGLPNPNVVLNPDWDVGYGMGPSSLVGTFVDERRMLYLHQANSNRIDIYNLENGQKTGEVQHNTGEYFQSLSWVQEGQVAGLCTASGKVRIMTYLGSEKKVIKSDRIDPFLMGAYDCQHHLFCAVGADYKFRIYCLEAWSQNLSTPTFEPASVYGLKANLVKTRLTGDDGKPIPDMWVHWELEGVGGPIIGSLDKAVSQTDQDGWAENFYYGPDEGLMSGQNKLKVRVVLY